MRFDDTTWQLPIRSTHPPAPPSGKRRMYALDDGWYSIDDAGVISKHSIDLRQPHLFFRDHMVSAAGNAAYTRSVTNAQSFNTYFYRNSPALGDKYELSIPLDAGDWIFGTLGVRDSGGGVETFKLNATTIGTFNYYAASPTYNIYERIAITINRADLYTFSAEVTSNGIGAGFGSYATLHFFTPRINRGAYGSFT